MSDSGLSFAVVGQGFSNLKKEKLPSLINGQAVKVTLLEAPPLASQSFNGVIFVTGSGAKSKHSQAMIHKSLEQQQDYWSLAVRGHSSRNTMVAFRSFSLGGRDSLSSKEKLRVITEEVNEMTGRFCNRE